MCPKEPQGWLLVGISSIPYDVSRGMLRIWQHIELPIDKSDSDDSSRCDGYISWGQPPQERPHVKWINYLDCLQRITAPLRLFIHIHLVSFNSSIPLVCLWFWLKIDTKSRCVFTHVPYGLELSGHDDDKCLVVREAKSSEPTKPRVNVRFLLFYAVVVIYLAVLMTFLSSHATFQTF